MTSNNLPLTPAGRRGRSKSRKPSSSAAAAASPSPARRFLTRTRSPSPATAVNKKSSSTTNNNNATAVSNKTPNRSSARQDNNNNNIIASVCSYEDVSTTVYESKSSRASIRSMSPARMLSRLNHSNNGGINATATAAAAGGGGGGVGNNKMTQSSPARGRGGVIAAAAASPARKGVSSSTTTTGGSNRSSSRTKRDTTTTTTTTAAAASTAKYSGQSPPPQKQQQQQQQSAAVEFVPLKITHTVSTPSRKTTHQRKSSGSANNNDFFVNNNNNTTAMVQASPAKSHRRGPSGSSGSGGHLSIPTPSRGGGASHTRNMSNGSIPTLYSSGSKYSNGSHKQPPSTTSASGGNNGGKHARVLSAGSIPIPASLSYGSGNGVASSHKTPPSQQSQQGQYLDDLVNGAMTPQRQYYQQQTQYQQQQQTQYQPKPKFEFESTPPTSSNINSNNNNNNGLPENFFSSNSVYGDSTTMCGSSIGDDSINGTDHLNDLLGVLNGEERERYFDGGYGVGGKNEYDVGKDGGYGRHHQGGGEYYNDYDGLKNHQQLLSSTPRRGYNDDPEVRVSVVTPSKHQRRNKGTANTSTSTNQSPTSIFSIFCGDITNDISESIGMFFSPKKQPQQQQELRGGGLEEDEDDEDEERVLMEKLQRLREKKWRGQQSGR